MIFVFLEKSVFLTYSFLHTNPFQLTIKIVTERKVEQLQDAENAELAR